MSCCLKNYAKKTVVLTPQRPQGAITPLTSELAKLEFKIEYWLYFKSDPVGQTKRHKIKLIVVFKDTFAVDVIAVHFVQDIGFTKEGYVIFYHL